MQKNQYYVLALFLGVLYLSKTGVGQTTVPANVESADSRTPSERHSNGYVPIFLRTVAGSSINNSSNNLNNMTSSSSGGNNAGVLPLPGIFRKPVPSAEIPPLQHNFSVNQSTVVGDKRSASRSQLFNVLDIVQNLDIRLKNIRNVELGVTIVQEIFDAMDFTTPVHDDNGTVAKLAARIRTKIGLARTVVANLSDFIRTNVTHYRQIRDDNLFLNTLIHPCPFDDFTLEQNYNKKQIQILNYLKINGYRDVHDRNFTVNTEIVEALRRSMHAAAADIAPGHFKHSYFLSRNDHASDHNCQYYFNDLNFRQLYASAIRGKHVLFLIDCGNSVAGEQIELSKQFVSNVVQMLAADDTITIVAIDNRAEVMELEGYENDTMRYRATMDRKDEIQHFIGQLAPSKELTNHSLGFQYAFELLKRQNISRGAPLEFVYVTRGLMSSLTEAKTVLDTIAAGQARLNEPITINTCVVILDEKRVMYEKQFLHDIAKQNYTKYEINVTSWFDPHRHKIRGSMFTITKRHPELIVKTSSAIFEKLFDNPYVSDEIRYHLPVLDYNTKDVIVSITKPVPQYGVVGVNLYLNDLAEEIVYFKRTDDSYAFLIDTDGMTIYHPAFPRPVATVKPLYPVDIRHLETEIDRNLRRRILNEPYGNETIVQGGDDETKITYTWNRVLDAYVVCLRSTVKLNGKLPVQLTRAQMASGRTRFVDQYQHHIDATSSSELLYHRIDLIPPPQTPVCRHFRQIATLDTGTIFLSASAFKSPFIYMKNNREIKDETQRTHNAQSIMAYIKDITNLLANPGLQSQIRNDVSALLHVMAYLKKRHLENGLFKKYIIRRYAATTNGVLQVYPGCILGTDLEPARRPWFRKAMKHSGRIVLTEPYLDAGGAGFIVTIAHTIFEGKSNALHNSERDLPIAIVALDVPYGFMYKLLLESGQLCSEENIKCLLMEDEGYLLAHPSIMEPSTANLNNRRPLEHITHKESFVANDILNHKRLVRKKACATFQNRVAQRYYEFNTSLTQVLTNNVVHGERTKYQIAAVPFTNIFAAVLNSTCEGGAFCPCSTSDRVCLNCNRMDQADCECPCECTLRFQEERNTTLGYCEPATESLAVVNSLSYDWSIVVKSCMNINCEMYATHADCLGVMGCEWCQLDIDLNPFPAPFCTAQNSCFNGVLGSVTPYGDGDLGSAIIEPVGAPSYSAIGPVGGALIVLCLVVGFAMYCYRQNLDNASEHLYGADSMQDDNYGVPLSRFNFDDISPHDDSDMSGGGGGGVGGANTIHRNLLHPLANVIAVNDLSPYHMSGGGYRRPNGESDHGYSTMTPHEDSEHMCFTLVEPLINNHKRLSMSADSMSITTSVSSPTNQPPQLVSIDRPPPNFVTGQTITRESHHHHHPSDDEGGGGKFNYPAPGQTFLEQVSPHHILAPVTVHRHMEAL